MAVALSWSALSPRGRPPPPARRPSRRSSRRPSRRSSRRSSRRPPRGRSSRSRSRPGRSRSSRSRSRSRSRSPGPSARVRSRSPPRRRRRAGRWPERSAGRSPASSRSGGAPARSAVAVLALGSVFALRRRRRRRLPPPPRLGRWLEPESEWGGAAGVLPSVLPGLFEVDSPSLAKMRLKNANPVPVSVLLSPARRRADWAPERRRLGHLGRSGQWCIHRSIVDGEAVARLRRWCVWLLTRCGRAEARWSRCCRAVAPIRRAG